MDKKEFAIGERFQCGLVTLKVVEARSKNGHNGCNGCCFNLDVICYRSCDNRIVGHCKSYNRSDNKNVIFKQVK